MGPGAGSQAWNRRDRIIGPTKSAIAKAMTTSPTLDRLLDLNNTSVTLDTLQRGRGGRRSCIWSQIVWTMRSPLWQES